MPHKRAKQSVRILAKSEKGSDLAPGKASLRNEAIPKSAARVLNAETIREEYKKKRKNRSEDHDGEKPGKRQKTTANVARLGKVSLSIQPGESIQHFNRRVEDDLRPLVKSAVQSSRAVERNVAKEEKEARQAKIAKKQSNSDPKLETIPLSSPPSNPEVDKHAGRPKEFAATSSSAPRRLNDIAHAPPEFKKLPRGVTSVVGRKESVLSMSQKLMMESEREKAIARYRELKVKRNQISDRGGKHDDEV